MAKKSKTHAQQTHPLNLPKCPLVDYQNTGVLQRVYDERGRNSDQWRVANDVYHRGMEHTDLTTGDEKPCEECAKRRVPTFQVRFPHFFEILGASQFEDDDALRRAMDAWPLPLWAAERNNQNIHVNPALVEYSGIPPEDFLGKGWTKAIHSDDVERASVNYRDGFISCQSFTFTYRIRRADGFWGCITDIAHPFYGPNCQFRGYVGSMYETNAEAERPNSPSLILATGAGKSQVFDFIAGSLRKAVICEAVTNGHSDKKPK